MLTDKGRIVELSVTPSGGPKGHKCAPALAKSELPLQTELTKKKLPRKIVEQVELPNPVWVCWFNKKRLQSRISTCHQSKGVKQTTLEHAEGVGSATRGNQ